MGRAGAGEEVGVAGGDDAVDRRVGRRGGGRGAGGTASTDRDRGPRRAGRRGSPRTPARGGWASASSSPSTASRKCTSRAPSVRGGGALLVAAGRDQRGEVLVGFPGALRAVGEHEQLDVRRRRVPTWRAWRRTRTRCRRGGRRSRAPAARVAAHGGRGHDAVASDASAPSATRSSGTSTSNARSRSRTTRSPRPEAASLGRVATERTGSVGEAEVGVGRDRQHRRAVVAVARHERDDRLGGVAGEASEVVRAREVGVGDTTRLHPRARRWSRPAAAAASREPGSSSTASVEVGGPVAHVGIRRHHDDRHRRRPRARPARPSGDPARRVRRRRATRRGGPCPARTRGSGSPRRDAWAREASGNIGPRMLPSVGSATSVAVIGAGSWGTTVAAIMSEHAPTTLWGRDAELVAEIDERPHELALPRWHRAARRAARDRSTSRPRAPAPTVVVMAVPSHGYRAVLERGRAGDPARRAGGEPGQGHRAGHAAAHDRGDARGARRPRRRPRRRAHRSQPRPGGRRGAAGGVGDRVRATRTPRASCSSCA